MRISTSTRVPQTCRIRTSRPAVGARAPIFPPLRATGSTVLSQMIDSFTVSFVFLAGTQSLGFITSNAANNYVGKLIMAVVLTPVIYAMHAVFRRRFHLPEPATPQG